MTKKERYERILGYFRATQPAAESELDYTNAFELLVAVMLSAQCTDKRVNMVTPALFRDYPTPQALAAAEEVEIYEYVKSISYPNAKAKHLVEMARRLVSAYNGEVPQSMEDLTTLPGVGRKTANVVQAVAFGMSAMPVDTHVFRVSHRMGLVTKAHNTPKKVEMELRKHIPEEEMSLAHHWLLLHGRYVCTSLKPKCDKCALNDLCPKKLENSKLR